MSAAKKLGELLVQESRINIDQLEKAKVEQKNSGGSIGSALVKLGFVKESELIDTLSQQYNVPAIDLTHFEVDPGVIKLIPRDVCEKHKVFPIQQAGNSVVVAMADPSNMFVRDDLAFVTRHRIEVVVASEVAIMSAIERFHGSKVKFENLLGELEREDIKNRAQGSPGNLGIQGSIEIMDLDKGKDDVPVVKLVNLMLTEAIKTRSSDIHVEPYEKNFRIRLRIDGRLYERMQPPTSMAPAIVSRLKIMSQLDISEKRRPQDGRMKIKINNGAQEIDFRVSTIPTLFGEKIVMRLLDKANLHLDMRKLGFESDELNRVQDSIAQPYGMVLVTGPTGSGKSTTIYSALMELNKPDVNISTAEDPVEYNLEGINQVQMNPEIDLTFASALRSFLRQDPDVIMVGEIRDRETAEIAIKASLTGHMVVSTLHTNDAPSALFRLINMGIEPFLVGSTVTCIVAQRLVRKICQDCKEPVAVEPEVLLKAGIAQEEIGTFEVMKGRGCAACNDIGYKGRVAIYEVMKFTDPLKEAIIKGATPLEIKHLAVKEGMRTLRSSAILKLKSGLTTLEEVVENSARDDDG